MKRLGIALAATVGVAGLAQAADLPTTKPPDAPPPENCYSSLWTWFNSSPADCPLSYAGFTVYATIDVGLGYESNGAGFNPAYANGVANFISKQSNGPKWLWTPNGINQTVVGITMREPIGWGWSLVGTVETGIRPVFRRTGQRSRVRSCRTTARRSSCRTQAAIRAAAGQWDNSAGVHRRQQPDLRHADGRPCVLADARRRHLLRSDGRLLRVLCVRLFRLLRGLRRH